MRLSRFVLSSSANNGAILVTGGGSGLGEGVVRRLRSDGLNVVILDLKPSSSLAAEVGCHSVVCDVSDEGAVQSAVRAAVDRYGSIRGAVNCAGIAIAQKVLSKKGVHSASDFERVLRVNVLGTFNVIRLCADQMQKQAPHSPDGERGVFVNTASVAAFDGQIGQVAYSASKGAIVGMMLPLAREFSSIGIRVVTIAPGTFDTPLLAGLPEPARQALAQQVPFPKRLGKPSEFGSLVSEIVRNPMINGEVIRIDGALRMQ